MPLRRLVGSLAAIGLVGIAFLLIVAVRAQNAPAFSAHVAAGERPRAPQQVLPLIDGSGSGSVAQYRGKVVVVNFYASWCGPCKDEAPVLGVVAARLKGEGVQMIGIDNEEVREDGLAYAKRYGLDYPIFHARGREAYRAWGLTGYPETYVLDRDGRATAWFSGPVSEAKLMDAVAAAQKQ